MEASISKDMSGSITRLLHQLEMGKDDPGGGIARDASVSIAILLKELLRYAQRSLERLRPRLKKWSEDWSEDLAQTAFMAALQHLKNGGRFKNREEFRRYLFGTLRRRTISLASRDREGTYRVHAPSGADGEDSGGTTAEVNPVDLAIDPREPEPGAYLTAEDLLETLFVRLEDDELQRVLLIRLATQQIAEDLLMELSLRSADQPFRGALFAKLAELQKGAGDPAGRPGTPDKRGIDAIAAAIGKSRAAVHRRLGEIRDELTRISSVPSSSRASSDQNDSRPTADKALIALAAWLEKIVPDVEYQLGGPTGPRPNRNFPARGEE